MMITLLTTPWIWDQSMPLRTVTLQMCINIQCETITMCTCNLSFTRNYISEHSIFIYQLYYAISIDHSHRKYLAFQFQGDTYQFNCLPFSLTSTPRVFTKIMKPAIAWLRQLSCRVISYILTTTWSWPHQSSKSNFGASCCGRGLARKITDVSKVLWKFSTTERGSLIDNWLSLWSGCRSLIIN